jgi:hypothetical protein
MHNPVKAKFTYQLDRTQARLHIVDLFEVNSPTMSVTNDIENVLTKILHENDLRPEDTFNGRINITYTDTEGELNKVRIEAFDTVTGKVESVRWT